MDHFPRPQMSMNATLEIPCLLDERYIYDGLGLSGFPERMGFHKQGMIRGDLGGRSGKKLSRLFNNGAFSEC
jgi:hypothetical protein